jgi:uncharacterized protein (UPF0264 family)
VQLLVSVRDAAEAAAALAGGADIVDAKEPDAGPLGAVSLDTLHAIVRRVNGARPVTAALGDAGEETTIEREARAFAQAGAALVKVGLAGVGGRRQARILLAAAARGAGSPSVIAVAYADAGCAGSPSPFDTLDAARDVGLAGILLDTADKHGPRLPALMPAPLLDRWIAAARQAGLLVAIAGGLRSDDIGRLERTGADIIGVRGAACDGGRAGQVSIEKVRLLKGVVHVSRADPVERWVRTHT